MLGAAASTGRSRARRVTALLGTALVLTAGGVVAAGSLDLSRVLAVVRTADPGLLALAVVGYLLSWPLRGRRYGTLLGATGHRCRVGFLTAAVFVSQATNLVVPARAGDGARAYLLNTRRDVPYATGAASLAAERLFDLLALAVLGAVALAWVALGGGGIGTDSRFLTAAVGVAVAGLLGTAVTAALARRDWHPGPALRRCVDHPRTRALVDAVIRFGADLRVVATDPRALGRVAADSLTLWALDVLTAVLVLAALVDGDTLSTPAVVTVGALAVTVGNLAKVLPLSQGGIGLYEAAFTALVVAVSPVGGATALAAAVLDHALKNLVTLAGGGVAALALNVSPRGASEQPADTDP